MSNSYLLGIVWVNHDWANRDRHTLIANIIVVSEKTITEIPLEEVVNCLFKSQNTINKNTLDYLRTLMHGGSIENLFFVPVTKTKTIEKQRLEDADCKNKYFLQSLTTDFEREVFVGDNTEEK